MSEFFQELINQTKVEREKLYSIRQIQDGINGDINLETYIAYLTEAYHHVKHTTPLLMAVGSRISFDKEWARNAIAEYIEEELGHQEWILSDIKNSDGDAEAVRNGKPKIATELMISYAYDSVMRKNPLSFFGMVFVLEGTSIKLATQGGEAIMAKLGLKKNSFSYLFSHGSLDIKHMEFFEKLMGQITDKQDQADIIHMAKVMFGLFADVFRSIPHNQK
jgi:pyrroloquinoline quinone (PQQ) biosynthesis protein C